MGTKFCHQTKWQPIAIYDQLDHKLFLFRDRMGIKPLFYTYKDDELIFASELKAIDKIKTNKQISHESIYSYLHLGMFANKTIYNDILKVKPGSILYIKKMN